MEKMRFEFDNDNFEKKLSLSKIMKNSAFNVVRVDKVEMEELQLKALKAQLKVYLGMIMNIILNAKDEVKSDIIKNNKVKFDIFDLEFELHVYGFLEKSVQEFEYTTYSFDFEIDSESAGIPVIFGTYSTTVEFIGIYSDNRDDPIIVDYDLDKDHVIEVGLIDMFTDVKSDLFIRFNSEIDRSDSTLDRDTIIDERISLLTDIIYAINEDKIIDMTDITELTKF